MNLLVPLTSLIGPIYFGVRGYSVAYVLAWAAVWTVLRMIATLKPAYAALSEHDGDEPPSWLVRHPYVMMPGVLLIMLVGFGVTHLAIYWVVGELVNGRI